MGPNMELLHWINRPILRRPALVTAFEGWSDAGEAASVAWAFLVDAWKGTEIATIDPEDFYQFSELRPTVGIDESEPDGRRIEWPRISLWAAELPGAERDLVFLLGPEPHLRWRTFAELIAEAGKRLSVDTVISLGSLVADVPHTRPVPMTVSSHDPRRRTSPTDLRRSQYEGPTGIASVLSNRMAHDGASTVSLWAQVPHYIAQTPSPVAALALVNQATTVLGLKVNTETLERAVATYQVEVNELVASDPEAMEYVNTLEAAFDVVPGPPLDEDSILPANALADEVERFLRGHQ